MVRGFVNEVGVDIMLDSVSLLRHDTVSQMKEWVKVFPQVQSRLVTASGDTLQVVDHVSARVQVERGS
jgi:hypothetical protein